MASGNMETVQPLHSFGLVTDLRLNSRMILNCGWLHSNGNSCLRRVTKAKRGILSLFFKSKGSSIVIFGFEPKRRDFPPRVGFQMITEFPPAGRMGGTLGSGSRNSLGPERRFRLREINGRLLLPRRLNRPSLARV